LKNKYYFEKFENRQPYTPVADNKYRSAVYQTLVFITIALGLGYLHWRWRFSLNPDSIIFSITLVTAETLSFLSTILIFISFWSYKDPPKDTPVHYLSEIEELQGRPDRPITIDIFITTYNEDIELVRLTIADAKKMEYPFEDVELKIYVLDDGRRDGRDPQKESMKKVTEEENVGYIIREHNEGYKAGNLKNALERTNGDLFVILDADARPFSHFLVNTSGYFKNKKVAWVQTPQWFFDTTLPESLGSVINNVLKLNQPNNLFAKTVSRINNFLFGKIKVNEDIFGNDGRLFYDVILRKRNLFNAAFCCGAGSIHRREAIMNLALKDFAFKINQANDEPESKDNWLKSKSVKKSALLKEQVIPFKFHASEDIYTSLMLHSDREHKWQSIQHPEVECRMLSPQDLDTWIKQRQRYSEGSLDIAINDNVIFKKGLTIGQKLCYSTTVYSYFAPLWMLVFLLSPLYFFFTQELPVRAYSFEFFKHFLPFMILNTVTITLGAWGINTKRGDQYYISSFWFMLMSIVSILRRKKVKFNVTPKGRVQSSSIRHIIPHFIIIGLTLVGMVYNAILVFYGKHLSPSGFAANTFWCFFNIVALSIMIRAAYWKPSDQETENKL
jgi:cellulose synthase (UDP-forming)